MNYEEKAKELVDKFEFIMPDINDDGTAAVKAAKQCALICVDEVINHPAVQDSGETYWQQVKQAIEAI